VIPAEYAFVLHTANPITGATGELFGEAVVGMGEALVGNQPGRALSFSATQSQEGRPQVELLSLPSKRCGLFSPAGVSNLIARSDSNGEDLEAFAGAGDPLLRPIASLLLPPSRPWIRALDGDYSGMGGRGGGAGGLVLCCRLAVWHTVVAW
jgi:hypothetical protein